MANPTTFGPALCRAAGAVSGRVCRSGDPARRLERLIARLVPEPGVPDPYRHPDHRPLGTAREAAA